MARRIVIEDACPHGLYSMHYGPDEDCFGPEHRVLDPGSLPESAIEAGARAIHDNDPAYSPPYWDDCDVSHKRWYREMARACLVAALGEAESADG